MAAGCRSDHGDLYFQAPSQDPGRQHLQLDNRTFYKGGKMYNEYTLRQMIRQTLRLAPEKTALIENNRQYSFKELADRTRGMGNALLDLGLQKGDRVAILNTNSIENAEAYFSIPNAGLVLVMLNFRLAPPEMLAILRDAAVSVLIIHENFMEQLDEIKPLLDFIKFYIVIGNASAPTDWMHYETLIAHASHHEPVIDIEENDLAVLMYTSGTTGVPKGCMVSHRNLYYVGQSMALEMEAKKEDSGIVCTPLFHASGEVVLMNGIYSATPTVIMPQWDVEAFLRLVEKYKITTGLLATPMLLQLINSSEADQYDISSLKNLLFAGAPVVPEAFKKAIERFGNIFIHGFGTSETVGSISILKPQDLSGELSRGRTKILGSCGRPYAGMRVEVVDFNDQPLPPEETGEIRVQGPGLTMGYWEKRKETRQSFRNGWFYTGDLGKTDKRNFLYIVGRKKDVIITGAENVFPVEVEDILYRHPSVNRVAVIGMSSMKWGEMVTAVVVKNPGCSVTQHELIAFCKQEIAGYKVPKKIFFADTLPMNASGKVLRNELKKQFTP